MTEQISDKTLMEWESDASRMPQLLDAYRELKAENEELRNTTVMTYGEACYFAQNCQVWLEPEQEWVHPGDRRAYGRFSSAEKVKVRKVA